jgi:ABC-2 type transport system ATP-binding protein
MEATIEVTGLRKRFGPTLALDGMSFTVRPGQVTGFVGPNGAGKSTTMRVILGLDAADQGTALIGGRPYHSLRHPLSHVGALLDVWMRGFLRALAAQGRAVLVSSHLMSELQDAADHLVVVGRGQVIADTSVADLIATASGGRVTLRTTARSEAMTVLAHAGATVAATDRGTLVISGLAAGKVVATLGESGVPFSEVSAHRATLEEAYMELTRDAVEFRAVAAEDTTEEAAR